VFWSGAIAAAQGAASYGVQKVSDLLQTVHVRLDLNLKFEDKNGNPIDPDKAADWLMKAEKEWTGRFGKFDVIADFNDPDAKTVIVTLDDSGGGGQPHTNGGPFGHTPLNGIGGDAIHMYTAGYVDPRTPFTPNTAEDNETMLAHEIGHALGLTDQYNGDTYKSFSGHAYDIMGARNPNLYGPLGSPSPFPDEIQAIQNFRAPWGGYW
jgi:hypothetical protein